MKKAPAILFILIFLSALTFGQFNPNAIIDSNLHNIPGSRPLPPNLILEKLDSTINRNLSGMAPKSTIQSNPFMARMDSVNVFDSLHGKLTIFVKNINKVIGTINVAIFNNYTSFVNNGPVFKGAILPVNASSMVVPFDSIPKGIYSVAIFHDEDKNGVLNKNQLNMPIEGYGFSNNAAGTLGPPSFAQTKFVYSGKNKSITIFLTYFKFPK